MATIARTPLGARAESPWDGRERWPEIAAKAVEGTRQTGVPLRDCVVLVPFLQLLAPARAAFARLGGWLPRIETTMTLAAALGPPAPAEPGQVSFDTALDLLAATQLLRGQSWGAAWLRRDARGLALAAAQVVQTAQALVRAAAALPPAARAAYWARGRAALPPVAGPGASERLLARVALEWASVAPAPASDGLFDLRPAGWIVVQAGAADALAQGVIEHAAAHGVDALVIDTDAPPLQPFALLEGAEAPAVALCADFEDEAQAAAAQVLHHLGHGEQPVALIAQDRVLVRRIRAMLEREQVALLDETGWTLSTTRAAAQVMGLLRAAAPRATTDALLDWLKAGTRWPGAAVTALEAACRRAGITRVSSLANATLDEPALALWKEASAALAGVSVSARQPLARWLVLLGDALEACGSRHRLAEDDAGRQVLAALRLQPGAGVGAAAAQPMALDEFTRWVDEVLELETFRPAAPTAPPQVVITPLARAMLRPFAAVVFPGADDQRLGAPPAPLPLLADRLAVELGLPGVERQREAELRAFGQWLALPRLTLLRRRMDGAEPLGDSPLVERLSLALVRDGRRLQPWVDPRPVVALSPTPVERPVPAAADLLPMRLSASACEALRSCPYRFHALHQLRLREPDELDGEIEKRDYGTWLHEVLFRFHESREAPADAAVEVARLLAIAQASRQSQGLSEAEFLPYEASFASFAPRYIAWLHERDAAGRRWQRGEFEVSAFPQELGGVELYGRIDRVDAVRAAGSDALELIDYKTGSAAGLKEKVRQPLEDTQLAFYAALVAATPDADSKPLRAIYLALDGSKGLEAIEHPQVERSAAALLQGLAHDLDRLRGGASLSALGEGVACSYCEARGLCRRDHWAATPAAPALPESPAE